RIDPTKVALLQGQKGESKGFTTDPLRVVPKISGGRPVVNSAGFAFLRDTILHPEKGATAGGIPAIALAGGLTILQATSGGMVTAGTPIAAASGEALLDVRADTEKDAKVFVGQCAPIAANETAEITHTIFTGNLTERNLGSSYIKIVVPIGYEAIRATAPNTNAIQMIEGQPPREYGGVTSATFLPRAMELPESNQIIYTWPKPLKAGTGIYWSTISADPGQVDCVTVTFRALPGTAGSTVSSSSCELFVANAMPKSPGPIVTTILKGDWATEQARSVQGAIEGAGFRLTPAGDAVLRQAFTPNRNSCTIRFGGANLLQLKPDSAGKAVSLVPLPFDRVLAIGHPDLIFNYQGERVVMRTLFSSPTLKIVAGPGTKDPGTKAPNGVVLYNYGEFAPGVYAANEVFNKWLGTNFNEFGTMLLAGGGSVVEGGANTIGEGSARPVTVTVPPVVRNTGPATVQLAGQIKLDVTALVPGNTAPAGPADIVVTPGSPPIIPVGGPSVLSHNGNAVVANDGAGVVANDGAGVVANDGAGLVGQDGAGLVGQDGAGIVAGGGLNIGIVAGGGGN
ncbi:MAG: hypothetical protein KDL87_14270, partial [Verrucomicrobiae bacterium]|nr:hypothetical protein [Verrucomicrobiae bacterium]